MSSLNLPPCSLPFTQIRGFNQDLFIPERRTEQNNREDIGSTARYTLQKKKIFQPTSADALVTRVQLVEAQSLDDASNGGDDFHPTILVDLVRLQNLSIFDAAVSSQTDNLITHSQFSLNNQLRLSCDAKGFIRLGDAKQGLPTRVIGWTFDREQIVFAPNGQYVAWQDARGLVYKRLAPEGEIKRQLNIAQDEKFTFSADSQSLILPQFCDASPAQQKQSSLKFEHPQKTQIQRLSLDSNTFDPAIHIETKGKVTATALSADGKYFFTVEDKIKQWSTETGELISDIWLESLERNPKFIDELVSSKTGKWLAFTSSVPTNKNKTNIHLYSLAGSEVDAYFSFFTPNTIEFKFSPSEQWLVALDEEGQITVCDMALKECIRLEENTPIRTISWGADNLLYAIDENNNQQVWEVCNVQKSNQRYRHSDALRSLADNVCALS